MEKLLGFAAVIEDPSSKLQGIFDRTERCQFTIRSLTSQQAAGNALAIAVQVGNNSPPWLSVTALRACSVNREGKHESLV